MADIDDVASEQSTSWTHSKTSSPSIPHRPSSPLSGSNLCLKRKIPPGDGKQHESCWLASGEQETTLPEGGQVTALTFWLAMARSEITAEVSLDMWSDCDSVGYVLWIMC